MSHAGFIRSADQSFPQPVHFFSTSARKFGILRLSLPSARGTSSRNAAVSLGRISEREFI